MDQTRIATLVADLQKRLDEKCRARYGRSMLVLDATHDQLDEASPLETRHGMFVVGLSIGVASLREDETRVGQLIERADDAMYVAKSAGRTSFLTVG